MANGRRDLFLVFNGAIYNYRELKDELASRGRRFASGSDTEVILHAYEEWGPDAVTRFNGMWAFALWDQRRRLLFCSRDRFGVKPFYYYLDDDFFIFASEIKALLPALLRRPSPDWPMLHAFLTRNAVCHNSATLLAGVQRLAAAHNLLVMNETSASSRYWSYDLRSHPYDYAHPEETFAALFDDSVRLRLRGDVPVGIALSGGLDSSAIAALARRHSNGPLKVFTAIFPDTPQDERRHAEIVARSLEAEHHLIAYDPGMLIDDLRRVVWHMDHPAPHPQVLPRWALMNAVARHVKVILEGQGSDEMLGGYPRRYFPFWLRDEIAKLRSPALFGACGSIARALAARYRADPRWTIAMLARRLGARSRRSLTPTALALSADFRAMARQNGGEPRRRGGGLDAALLRDHERDLLPWLLMLGDAISMGWSLESRLPFLDYRLVEFCFGLDREWKFDGVETKIILRRTLSGLVPPAIATRPDKVGFDVPLGQWIAGSIDEHIRPVLLSARARRRSLDFSRRPV
jgi:asparagine synthase (glutamine-hydrolysing)